MKLSFIIVTYKRGQLLQDCLQSIYAQQNLPRPYEVILVDNGGDAQIVAPSEPDIQLRVECPPINLGCPNGRNFGMELAQGEYWVFIDDDATWSQNVTVARALTILDSDPTYGALAMKSLHPATSQVIREELPHPQKDYLISRHELTEVPYFYGYAHVFRAAAIQKIGMYPQRYQMYSEEYDLSIRLIQAGYKIVFDPHLAVFHHRSNLGRLVHGANYWRLNTLNKARTAWRLLPYPYPFTILMVWSLRMLQKTRQPRLVLQVWRDLWRERRLLLQERQPLMSDKIQYLKRIGARLLY